MRAADMAGIALPGDVCVLIEEWNRPKKEKPQTCLGLSHVTANALTELHLQHVRLKHLRHVPYDHGSSARHKRLARWETPQHSRTPSQSHRQNERA